MKITMTGSECSTGVHIQGWAPPVQECMVGSPQPPTEYIIQNTPSIANRVGTPMHDPHYTQYNLADGRAHPCTPVPVTTKYCANQLVGGCLPTPHYSHLRTSNDMRVPLARLGGRITERPTRPVVEDLRTSPFAME